MVRVVQIGKRRWLAGLTWSSFEDVPSKAELKDDAQRLSASWACVRIGESSIQAGFCAPVPNTKPVKLFSLAAMLADSREQPWLGIFKIEEGLWWYIAVRDGHAILPDGDVIGCEAEIHAARDRHAGYTDWKYIDGDIHLLEEIISEIDVKPSPVKSLTGGNLPSIPLMLAAVLLVSASGGGYLWWQNKVQAEAERARVAAMEKLRAQMANQQAAIVAPTLPSPLLTSAPPNLWLAACGKVIREMPLSQYGWTLNQISCDQGAAQIRWDWQPGATVANKPDGALTPSGDKVDQIIPLAGLNGQWPDDAIDLADAILILRAWAQAVDFGLVVNAVAPPVAPPPLPGATILPQTNPAPVPPPQVGIRLVLPVSPFGMDLTAIPGLRLTKLSSNGATWNIEGILYGR